MLASRDRSSRLGGAIAHYEQAIKLPIPDKLPMPLRVHRRNGEPCPRCGDQLEAVFYEDYVMCYCPTCQTERQAAEGPAALAPAEIGSWRSSLGDKAPDFTLPDQDGQPVKLSELRGKPVVLYFYPKADTPGCTTQACGVRDHSRRLRAGRRGRARRLA